jgi:hypothetical protein
MEQYFNQGRVFACWVEGERCNADGGIIAFDFERVLERYGDLIEEKPSSFSAYVLHSRDWQREARQKSRKLWKYPVKRTYRLVCPSQLLVEMSRPVNGIVEEYLRKTIRLAEDVRVICTPHDLKGDNERLDVRSQLSMVRSLISINYASTVATHARPVE